MLRNGIRLMVWWWFTPVIYAGSANDDFDSAVDWGSALVASDTVDFAGTSREPEEPRSFEDKGVWYRWTPSETIVARLSLGEDVLGYEISVYTGDALVDLVEIEDGRLSASFLAVAEETYHIAFRADNSIDGEAILNLETQALATNDRFAERMRLESVDTLSETFTMFGATVSADDPADFQNENWGSLWWEWEVPTSGRYLIESRLGLIVFRGEQLEDLVAVESEEGEFMLEAGAVFQIAVLGSAARWEDNLSIVHIPVLKNDAFAGATFAGAESSFKVAGSNFGASREPGEDWWGKYRAGDATVWWTWTAPYTAMSRVWIAGGSDLVLNVFKGESLDSLRGPLIPFANTGSSARAQSFIAEAGVTYRIVVAEEYKAPRFDPEFILQLRMEPALNPFDFFESPLDLGSARHARAAITTTGTSYELGEEVLAVEERGSAWARWVAPESGWYRFRVFRPRSVRSASVWIYTGSDLSSLSEVASGFRTAYWFAEKGVSYSMRMVGDRGREVGELYVYPQLLPVEVTPVVGGLGNDSMANAAELESSVEGEQSSSNAGADGPLWWSWQAPESGVWRWSTTRSSVTISVYDSQGVRIRSGDKQLVFRAEEGKTYGFEFSEDVEGIRTYTIQWEQIFEGTNDAFAMPRVLSGLRARESVGYWEAMLELGENPLALDDGQAAGGSFWWAWTAPNDAEVSLSVGDSEFDAAVGVYTGNSIESLELLDSGNSSARFVATAGVTYRIAGAALDGDADGEMTLNLTARVTEPEPEPEPEPELMNDDFANGEVLPGARSVHWRGEVGRATLEPDEQVPHGSFQTNGSRWWRWVCPETGVYEFEQSGSAIAIFTGSELTQLQEVPVTTLLSVFMGPGLMLFPAEAGETYHFAFAAREGSTLTFSIGNPRPSGNDLFGARTRLEGDSSLSFEGSNVIAGTEEGEPEHEPSDVELKTLWWEWVAPITGDLTVSFSGSLVTESNKPGQPALAMYRGTDLNSLSLVDLSNDGPFEKVSVRKGEIYQFALYGKEDAVGTLRGRLSWLGVARNDDFDSRIDLLAEVPVRFDGTTLGATAEQSDPLSGNGSPREHTIWWQWEAPETGEFTWHVRAASDDTRRAVFLGDLVETLERETPDYLGTKARTFSAVAGRVYQFVVSAPSGESQGAVDFQLERAEETAPDQGFEFALPFAGDSVSYNTFWDRVAYWTWTAPKRGWFEVEAVGGRDVVKDPYVSLYLPSKDGSGTSASRVEYGGGSPRHFAEEGEQFYFRLTGTGEGVVSVRHGASNDLFAGRIVLPTRADFTEEMVPSQVVPGWEPGEPFHATLAPTHSVWYEWRAPVTGYQEILLVGGDAFEPTSLAVYQGQVISQLREIVSGGGTLKFHAVKGESYKVAVNSSSADHLPSSLVFGSGEGEGEVAGYDAWIAGFDVLESQRIADPDGDGLMNVLEFALGLSPDMFDSAGLLDVSQDGADLTLEYARPAELPGGIEYFYEVSKDLVDWRRLVPGQEFQEDVVVDVMTAYVRVSLSMGEAASYLRLAVESP